MSAAARWLRRQYGYGPWFAWYAVELAKTNLSNMPGKDS